MDTEHKTAKNDRLRAELLPELQSELPTTLAVPFVQNPSALTALAPLACESSEKASPTSREKAQNEMRSKAKPRATQK